MPVVVYRLQPWAFVDRLVFDACPAGFDLVPMTRDATPEARTALLAPAQFLMGSWVTTSVMLTEADYAAAPHLRLVQVMSAGYEHVDIGLAARHGVRVATFGDAMASVVAEHTLMLMLAVYRQLPRLDAAVRSGTWRQDEPVLRELRGKRVGLVGLGYIGRAVATLLAAFGAEVAYSSRGRLSAAEEATLRVMYASFDELLAISDVVSLHVPLAPSTRGLIGARELALMKPTGVLINTSRGPVVDQAALAEALASGRLAGAGLDVLDLEPPAESDPLLKMPNVVFTPHTAGQAEEVWPRIVHTCFDNIQRVSRGEPPRYLARELT
jgi:glyoxylate reductase/D-3-phosphoglycerate dehydrogenase